MTELDADILLVEGNPADARLIMEALESARRPHRVVHRAGGEEALAYLAQGTGPIPAPLPRLIILDVSLAQMEGRRVLAELKSDARLKRIPVVVLTASASEDDVQRAYDLSANCYVIKPSDQDDFRKVVQGIEEYWLQTASLPGG
jgi:chemotaxis family two-component system response regulator Rcp1